MFHRRHVVSLAVAAAGALLLASAGSVQAQGKQVRLVVPFPPGGPVDFVARVVAEQLGKELGQVVIVDNKAGANGAIAAGDVMRSAPDGTTLWVTSVGAASVNQSLYEKLPYDMARDFAPVSLLVNNVELLVVNPNDPARDAAEFVANSKKKKDGTSMASSGIGSIPHFAIEQFNESTGANFVHVPYKGAAPAISDVIGGQVGGFFGDIPGLISHVQGGKVRPLGLASTKRHPALPGVKTLAEQGIANVDTNNWYALYAPAKTPPAVIANLNAAVKRTLTDPALSARLLATGAEPAPSSPAELAALQQRDAEKWARLIHDRKIKVE